MAADQAPLSRRGPPPSQQEPISQIVASRGGPMAMLAHERLTKALGPTRATDITREVLSRLGSRELESPQDLLDFAVLLIKHGGLVQAVGRSLKVQALLRGAVE